MEFEVLLTPEQEAELEESFAEIERGEYVDGDDIIRELRRRSAVVTTNSADEEYIPTDEEAAELEAGLDELDRGESVPLEEVMRELRDLRAKFERKNRAR